MALGDTYATSAQLKTYLGIGDAVDDTAIADAVASASRDIEKYCGRQFNDAGSASARVYRPLSAAELVVEDFLTTTGLVIKTDEDDDGVYETTWASSDYLLEPLNGIVDGELGWPYRRVCALNTRWFPTYNYRPPVQVTARWGWTAVPAGVKQACLILASDTFGLKDARFGVQAYGDFAMRIRDNPRAEAKLKPYRLNPIKVG